VIRSQLLKGTVPFLVLSVLAEGELYGYQIAQRIRDRSGRFWPRARAVSTRPCTASSARARWLRSGAQARSGRAAATTR
jgi:hypothetical protein